MTKIELDTIFSMATQNYINDARPHGLDDQQFKTLCFIKAIEMKFGIKIL